MADGRQAPSKPAPATYEIVRFRRDGPNRVIRTGVGLAEAQAWCERDDTHGDGWFDGYRKERPR